MRKTFVTGITGTVAPYLKTELDKNGYEVYDKHFRIENDNVSDLENYLNEIKPDIIFHLALGPFSFIESLVSYCNNNDTDFVYVSTVSVFEDNGGGPYYPNTEVHVTNDYGKYKYDCEQLVSTLKPNSYIIRIGWQISDKGEK